MVATTPFLKDSDKLGPLASRYLNVAELPWQETRFPGVDMKVLVEDKESGPVIVGVVSWSTGPNGSAGCGGMTGVTPLTLYRDWILQTARQWGAGL